MAGDDRSSLAELLGISLAAAAFHEDETFPSMMTLLNRSRNAGYRDERLFRMHGVLVDQVVKEKITTLTS